MRAARIATVAVILVTACVGDGSVGSTTIPLETATTDPVGPSAPTSLGNPFSSLPMCADTPYVSAPADWYRDTPLYVSNEMPRDEVGAFASQLDGYQNIWVDRDHHGWVTVGFYGVDVELHQAALEAEFPDVGVVAVELPYTASELNELARRLDAQLPDDMDAESFFEGHGVVEVMVGAMTPGRIALVEQIVGDSPVCLVGEDPSTVPAPGPQRAGGEGWTYLGEADTGDESGLLLITDQVSLEDRWAGLLLEEDVPQVDFEANVVLTPTIRHSSSCPETRLDGVRVEHDLVYPVVVDLRGITACTADGVPRTYFLSLDRDLLPAPPFRIAMLPASEQQITVEADLREPGTEPAEGEVYPTTAEASRTAVAFPLFVEPLFPQIVVVDLECGIGYLGVINTVPWHTADGSILTPPEWETATVGGLLDLELFMTEGPAPTLTATAGGLEVLYLPGPDEGQPCG